MSPHPNQPLQITTDILHPHTTTTNHTPMNITPHQTTEPRLASLPQLIPLLGGAISFL